MNYTAEKSGIKSYNESVLNTKQDTLTNDCNETK